MFIKLLLALLISACFAFAGPTISCDGISPDTVFPFIGGVYLSGLQDEWSSYPDSTSCAFYGDSSHSSCGVLGNCAEAIIFEDNSVITESNYVPFVSKYSMTRGVSMFIVPLGTMRDVDSVDLRVKVTLNVRTDDDTFFVLSPEIRCEETCTKMIACYEDSCNFYRCGGAGANWPESYLDYWIGETTGWVQFDIDGECRSVGDTAIYGFATRRFANDSSPPTGGNTYWFASQEYGDTTAMLIYHFSLKYNDISCHSADGISPDTLYFICSEEFDSVRTPGYWRNGYISAWNNDPDPIVIDCFHGRRATGTDTCFGCGISWVGSFLGWHYAEQPLVRALKRPVFNDFEMMRAYFLLEIEQGIPDTTEIDSAFIRMQFASVDVPDGDSVFVVPYAPRYSESGSDSCSICYSCLYPNIKSPTHGWCNYWKCNGHEIWGGRDEAVESLVPVYLGWNTFPVPDFIDFSSDAIGDTFGVGLVMRFEDSEEPTGENKVAIMTNPCPYIVYYFSEPEDTTAAGYINWGIKPPHLNWGLPVNQARRMYGGSRKP